MKTRVVLVGGFLGAGKTTLLWEAAKRLTAMGKRVGLVTNDQAPGLVDTKLLAYTNLDVAEVSGSCFCCNFNGFRDALLHLRNKKQADIILAEPVGSCADLSATIMQPMKDQMEDMMDLGPLTVLIDPQKLQAVLEGQDSGLHPSAGYIIQKQLEEADRILISKADLYGRETIERLQTLAAHKWPTARVAPISVQSKDRLDAWIEDALGSSDGGGRIAEVDYKVYAEGEAALGWLNASFMLKSELMDWEKFAGMLLQYLARRFDYLQMTVGHVKILIKTDSGFITGSITGKADTVLIRGSTGRQKHAQMIINARVQAEPDRLKGIVMDEMNFYKGLVSYNIESISCLRPGKPEPTYRFSRIVN